MSFDFKFEPLYGAAPLENIIVRPPVLLYKWKLWELTSVTNDALWFYCNSLKMVTGVLSGAFVLCMLKTILVFSWVPACENAYLDYSLGVTNSLCRKMAGETDFLEQTAFHSFQGSP